MNYRRLVLISIFLLAFFLRFYNLSNVPPSPTVDEVSIGYNAYSILKTGADEYGQKLPLLLRAYDDFRPAFYVYLAIPALFLFDLAVISVRLPSVILSTLSVLSFYLLTKEIFRNSNIRLGKFEFGVAEISSLLLAVSPWHVYISRLGHEVNAYLAFLIFGLLFFVRFLEGKPWNLILSSIFFALSFNSYQSGKLVVPLLLIVLFLLFFKKITQRKFYFFISLLLAILISLSIVFQSFGENALIRYKATSIFENSPSYFEEVSKRYSQDLESGNFLGQVFDNRRTASLILVSRAYLSHFDPAWLSLNKGNEPFKAPSSSLLYLFSLPLVILGFLFLRNAGAKPRYLLMIIFLGLISVLPGSITTGYPHAMRSIGLVLPLQIFSAIGLVQIVIILKARNLKLSAIALFLLAIVGSTLWFFRSYFILLPREIAYHFNYGPIIALSEVKEIEKNYPRIIVSNKDRLFESYMFYLYVNKYDPIRYQESGGTVSGGFNEEHVIGKYIFGDLDSKLQGNSLYVINPNELSSEMEVLKDIKYPNGESALLITDIK